MFCGLWIDSVFYIMLSLGGALTVWQFTKTIFHMPYPLIKRHICRQNLIGENVGGV